MRYPLAPNNGKEKQQMATQITPALFSFPGITDAWVKLSDLARQLEMAPNELWHRFFSLTKTEVQLSVVYDSWGAASLWQADENGRDAAQPTRWVLGAQEAFSRVLQNGELYVPAGWAKKVLSYHKLSAHRYEHPAYKAGTPVRILPEYRELHPQSPVAGEVVMAWYGIKYNHPHLPQPDVDEVPVLKEGTVWYVDVKYVSNRLV